MKILLVDDHLLFLEGLRLFLQRLPFSVEIISAVSVDEAEKAVGCYGSEIGLALVDLNLPRKGGVLLVRKLASTKHLIPTIIVSAEDDIDRIKKGLRAGARGFIPKSLSGEAMISAVLLVLEGGYYLPDSLAMTTVEVPEIASMGSLPLSVLQKNRIKLGVSKRQYDTLLLMAKGLSNRAVADSLFLSEHTVKSHTSMLFRLLDATNRTECVLRAKELRLIE